MLKEKKNVIPKFPKIEVLPIPIDDKNCSQKCGYADYETHIVKTEKWRVKTIKKIKERRSKTWARGDTCQLALFMDDVLEALEEEKKETTTE